MHATPHRTFNARDWPICLALLMASGGLLAQTAVSGSIQIQTPQLPPRQGQAPAAAPAQQAAYGQQGPAPQANAAFGAQPAQGGYGAQPQQAFGPQGGQNSFGQAQPAYQPQQGAMAQAAAHAAPAFAGSTGPAPTRAGTGGPCRVDLSPDRQTLSLLGTADSLPRQFLPLGEFRAQQVVHSPDGRWAVAFLKLRGRSQFAMLTLDLAACKEQRTIDLAQAGEEATFDGDNVTVRSGGKDQQWALADKRVR